MSCALMRVVRITEVGRAAFPPSVAGDLAETWLLLAGNDGNVLRPTSLIIGKGVINGGGGATKPVRCLLAGGGSDVGATLPAS